jgi:hypothetical protein
MLSKPPDNYFFSIHETVTDTQIIVIFFPKIPAFNLQISQIAQSKKKDRKASNRTAIGPATLPFSWERRRGAQQWQAAAAGGKSTATATEKQMLPCRTMS